MVEQNAALAARLSRRLKKRNWTISTAESCTGGLIASLLTDMSGASNWFNQGWIVYSNESKTQQLGVDESYFKEGNVGAVSHEVAIQLARGARYRSNSDVSIAITGIAGPKGSSENKEVGRVHVAIIARDYFLVRRMDFGENDRLDNKRSFAAFGLRLALEAMDNVDEKENIVDEKKINIGTKNKNIDISSLDSLSEEWEGKLTWQPNKKTVVQDISKIDLASLTDWDSNPNN
ncbi:MAG: CinA family protein [Euryarchaeota archaeon]|nr:CinA family protein [Euryarchaeota archaeon]MBT4391067.1 CinA family protein [Euryarchaeota archaeon]MBT4802577.1 CinA family protein [Euryarchaeota archaeon]MBT5613507.1 CinA family protein [Euryarchaeota archaeon]MBT6683385.1 CinA family protein [Euryarchaeota archaeon]